jgi:Zn-dependent protease
MPLEYVDILFQLIVFLFAISVHESAHAWMANRRGDPTARMLGRISLNPIKHIDPVGTVLMPLIAAVAHIPVIGWAKPTPVDPRNFKNPVLDDILTAVVGPISNFVVAAGATIVLLIIKHSSAFGSQVVFGLPLGWVSQQSDSLLVPFCFFIYELLIINVVLAVFNLIPVPPLDGSHVIRHFLPESIGKVYDTAGWIGLLALVYLGGGLISALIRPFLRFFTYFLVRG